MKSIDELNERKIPIVKIKEDLKKYKNDTTLFKDKVAKANDTLKRVGLPKAHTLLNKS